MSESTELSRIGPSGLAAIQTSTFAGMDELADRFSQSDLVGPSLKGKKQNCFLFLMAANELEMGYVTAVNNLYIVEGQNGPKISASADYMIMRARMFKHRVRHTEEGSWGKDNYRITTTIVRCDDPEFEHSVTWSLDQARQAGLYDGTKKTSAWYKFPRAMLRHRADAECVRMACGEVLGVAKYTPEELGQDVHEDGTPIITTARPSRAIPTPAQSITPAPGAAEELAQLTAAPAVPKAAPTAVKTTAATAVRPPADKVTATVPAAAARPTVSAPVAPAKAPAKTAPIAVKTSAAASAAKFAGIPAKAPVAASAAPAAAPAAAKPARDAQEICSDALNLIKEASRTGKTSDPEVKKRFNLLRIEMSKSKQNRTTVTIPGSFYGEDGKDRGLPLEGCLGLLERDYLA